jgi:hypothetical protein
LYVFPFLGKWRSDINILKIAVLGIVWDFEFWFWFGFGN